MTKLDAALLKLEGALDYTVDPQVRTMIDIAQQAIETAKRLMEERPQEVDGMKVVCIGRYEQAA